MHLYGENLKMFIFMPPKELWEAYSNRTVRPSVPPSRFRVRSISPIFFEVGIPVWCVDTSWDGGVSRTILGSL